MLGPSAMAPAAPTLLVPGPAHHVKVPDTLNLDQQDFLLRGQGHLQIEDDIHSGSSVTSNVWRVSALAVASLAACMAGLRKTGRLAQPGQTTQQLVTCKQEASTLTTEQVSSCEHSCEEFDDFKDADKSAALSYVSRSGTYSMGRVTTEDLNSLDAWPLRPAPRLQTEELNLLETWPFRPLPRFCSDDLNSCTTWPQREMPRFATEELNKCLAWPEKAERFRITTEDPSTAEVPVTDSERTTGVVLLAASGREPVAVAQPRVVEFEACQGKLKLTDKMLRSEA